MTKKTNSLLFRLSISSFWKNKSPNFHKFINVVRLEKILYFELKKRKLDILYIKWTNDNAANIWVYDALELSNIFKQEVFQFLKKTRNSKRLLEIYSIPKWLLLKILIDKRFYIHKNLLANKNYSFSIVAFLIKKYENKRLLKITKIISTFQWIKLNFIIQSLSTLKHSNNFLLNRQISSPIQWQLKLKKIWSLCFFKTLNVYLENIIFFTKQINVKISINNIWSKKGPIFQYHSRDTFLYQILMLSSLYNNSQIFSEFLAVQLNKDKNHRRLLRRIVLTIQKFWFSYDYGFNGLQLRVSGKLNGNMRKSRYQYILGKISLQTLTCIISYSTSISYTKFGVLSNKLWLCYGNK